ncbi:DEAD/DEAH box helicase [Marivibrio halodurans]|uniref:DEAD-box ATP-dependent RNA helicase RhpA n=1 Tax=Marivibrio halodurans TaxID=2039722 RepID=A0A8J7RZ54_9PROT|nr:DEAD/DEAH box helicase [Marivibrio halodurans]MBP5855763.1 DEAD/DEAH box helicase [Marivibrio halodurans]
MTTFADLGLSDNVLRAVSDAGYESPTPIQAKAIPPVLMNKDILGCAQTGTGKTASFTLPMIDILSQGRGRARMPRSVILEPTRELAAQVAENFETYGKYCKLEMALLIGGVSFTEQEQKITRGVDVLIATPGRLMDHCERGKVILTDTKILVIDEADRMLDMGFIPDVEHIVSLMPRFRQTLMFSATMPKEIRRLADKFLDSPKEITVAPPATTADTIEQSAIPVSPRGKRRKLTELLRVEDVSNALVFCNRKRDVATLYRSLEKDGFKAGALHGDMDQYKRMEWLAKFRDGEINVLVCSDVAARGLDIPSVSHVFNYDVPNHSEDYVHRVGRTGRAGRKGKSVTLVTENDDKQIAEIEKLIGRKINLEKPAESDTAEAPESPAATAQPVEAGDDKAPSTKKGRAKKSRSRRPAEAAPREAGEETSKEPTGDKKPAANDEGRRSVKPREPRGARSSNRRGERVPPDVPPEELNKPFGETDLVPAFLRR